MNSIKNNLIKYISQAISQAIENGELPSTININKSNIVLEQPKITKHGEFATNLAMQIARSCKKPPEIIAKIITKYLGDANGILIKTKTEAPGFINFFIHPKTWIKILPNILHQKTNYGRDKWGQGQRVLVELVSANPTGPLHIGHGRIAIVGDVIARLFKYAGYDVTNEYYINDAGKQITTLGNSILFRAQELKNKKNENLPNNYYQGEYIKKLAADYITSPEGNNLLNIAENEAIIKASLWGKDKIIAKIKEDLQRFSIKIDSWFSEKKLINKEIIEKIFNNLKINNLIYESEGALWFRSSVLGDKKDRVLKRSNGELTYFANDIAYHQNKFNRNFNLLINVWGADHHGYIPRIKAAITGLKYSTNNLKIILVQMVNLIKNGTPISMSTRLGQFVTLKQVIDEVGTDNARFLFLTRRSDAQLDFDLKIAKTQNIDNPVYYVQYAYTRIQSVIRKAKITGIIDNNINTDNNDWTSINLNSITLPEELIIIRILDEYPELIKIATLNMEPHKITYYLYKLAGAFHSYYNNYRILDKKFELTIARLALIQSIGIVLASGLQILDVSTPDIM